MALAASGALALGSASCEPVIRRRLLQIDQRRDPRHAAWIWQFSYDGSPHAIAETLAAHRMAAIVKTHDGIDWMATFDHAEGAIAGPAEVAAAARTFEAAGVPFHAWAVVRGVDPLREAEMAAQVLDAGARSLTLDLEEGDGFWEGTRDGARAFGEALRGRHELARIDVSIDPRPWKWFGIPLREFIDFSDGIRPQLYWDLFDDVHHMNAFGLFGLEAPGMSPEFLVEASQRLLSPFDRWIVPIGHGHPPATVQEWLRFVRAAQQHQMPEVGVWRLGVTQPEVLRVLAAYPPGAELPAA